jgi:PAS domain S-box-containing protein
MSSSSSRQIRMLRSLVLQRCRISAMTDHAIVVTDTDGTITWWSPGAEALFGLSAAAALGQSLDLIVPDALRARHWAGFRRAMEAPQVKDLAADMPVVCADGQVKEFAGRLLVLADGLGAALGAMGIFAADGTTGIKPFR